MKLFKGILVIALVSVIAVSCKEAKKDVDAVKDGVENVADETIEVTEGAAADADKLAVNHSCEQKCSEECVEKDCAKCAVATAAHKAECTANKVKEKAGEAVDAAKEVAEDAKDAVKDGAKVVKDAVEEIK